LAPLYSALSQLADNPCIMAQLLRLPEFAKKYNLAYGTVYKHWNKGWLIGKQLPSGTILVERYKEEFERSMIAESSGVKAILYARVKKTRDVESDTQQASSQLAELEEYALASGYEIVDKTGDIGMALDPNRRKFTEVLNRSDWDILLVKNREIPMLTGMPYLEAALGSSGRRIEYLEPVESNAENVALAFIKDTQHLLGPVVIGVSKRNVRSALERLTS
jgi:putative resolvase